MQRVAWCNTGYDIGHGFDSLLICCQVAAIQNPEWMMVCGQVIHRGAGHRLSVGTV